MKCCDCGSVLDQSDICPGCGRNVRIWKKIHAISARLYNEGLSFAKKRFLTDAREKLTLSLIYNKRNTQARNLLGLILFETGEYYQAFSEWLISLDLEPENNPARRLLYRARESGLSADRMSQIIRKYNQSILYCRQHSFDLAIIQLNQILEIDSRLLKGHLLIALALMQTGRYDEALRHLDQVAEIDRNHPDEERYRIECRRYVTRDGRLKKKHPKEKLSTKEHLRMFADRPLFATVLNLLIGAAAGAAVIAFLVMPGIRSHNTSLNSNSLVEANETISSKNETITELEESIAALEKDLSGEKKARKKSDQAIKAYDALFQAKTLYDQEKYEEAGKAMEEIDGELLSEDAKKLYDQINTEVQNAMLLSDYNAALEKYWNEDWNAAVEGFKAITDQKKDFNDCQAALYLGDSYLELGDTKKAKKWLTYCVDHTGSESVRAKANRRLRVANGEPEYGESDSEYEENDSEYEENQSDESGDESYEETQDDAGENEE